MKNFKVASAQINTTVGDLEGNTKKILEYIRKASESGADLVVFPELAVTGYPPKDLLLKKDFIRKNRLKLDEIIRGTKGIASCVGFVDTIGEKIYNAAALIKDEKLLGVQHKTCLPEYDVFYEKRYFEPAKENHIFELANIKLGLTICEDIWVDDGTIKSLVEKGAECVVNISASPFHVGKTRVRRDLVARRARENKVFLIYVNLVGGQDDLVFDGGSYVFNEKVLIAQAKHFQEDLLVTDLRSKAKVVPKEDPLGNIHSALILGIRDYTRKNNFKRVVVGLSGGIDSSLTATLAVEALGKENVIGILMPSKYSSEGSITDAKELARNLGIEYRIIPIQDTFDAYLNGLSNEFKNTKSDVTEENIQARIRGNILMALSNKFNYLVLSTGNKSEIAVGYTTLYGDMAGGLAVLSDVPKTTVYKLAEHVNSLHREVIPESVLTKEPSAELRVGQRDSDSLPSYDILDVILHHYIEENKDKGDIMALGFDEKVIEDVIRMVDSNEYKRKQAPIGIKITPKAFGSGRRMPITNKYRG